MNKQPTSLVLVLFPGLKWPGREVNYSSLSIAEVKNEWSYTAAPSVRLHGVDRENFIFYLFNIILLRVCLPNGFVSNSCTGQDRP